MLNIESLMSIRLVAFDFDGVFTDNAVYINQDGIESVRCWRSDGLGLARLRRVGVHVVIISTETNPVVSARARKLELPYKQGVADKAAAVLSTCNELRIDPQQTMFVGNDINDISAFQSIGVPVGVADAYPEIDPYILYRTQKPGGFGAVREICDLVYNAKIPDLSTSMSHDR
jgi:3-deoxy-D-manno-octulosonate 8-phosphate phosphatase (KDO 8-P phosphatase)